MNRDLVGCTVAPAKIGRYLLDTGSRDGASKARFFQAFGFDASRPDELAVALRKHAATQAISDRWTDIWGEHWNVTGPIETPDGRMPTIQSAWIKDGEAPPRLVTAFPA